MQDTSVNRNGNNQYWRADKSFVATESTLAPLLERFSERQVAVKDELRTYAECDSAGFREEALQVLCSNVDEGAKRYVIHLLLKYARLTAFLTDPGQCDCTEAIRVAKAVWAAGVPLDSELEKLLENNVRKPEAGALIIRILTLFEALSLGKRVLPMQEQLMSHKDPEVRSKAALEIGKASRNPAWVAHVLLHGDSRVQANAVESLWDIADKNVRPVLMIAARSPNPRVAANGLVGLYRQGALDCVPQLLKMAEHAEAEKRASAVWAMGQTGDQRFLTFLNRAFAKAGGKEKHRIVKSLSRIRQRLRAAASGGEIRMTVLEAKVAPDGARQIVMALWSHEGNLSALTPADFAVWESDQLVTDYSSRCVASPPVLIIGFGLPRFPSRAEPYAQAVEQAMNGCLDLRRNRDPWCVDRYQVDEPSNASEEPSLLGVDERSLLAMHMKKNRGFIMDSDWIRKVIQEPGARALAAKDVVAGVEKLVDITSRMSGARHLFVFFDPGNTSDRKIQKLAESVRGEPITMHGFAPDSMGDCGDFRDVCLATNSGTFQSVSLDRMAAEVVDIYLGLIDRYEITYRVESTDTPGPCEVRLSTTQACGQSKFDFAKPD